MDRTSNALTRDECAAVCFRLSLDMGIEKVLIKLLWWSITIIRNGARLSWSHVINIPLGLMDNDRIQIERKMQATFHDTHVNPACLLASSVVHFFPKLLIPSSLHICFLHVHCTLEMSWLNINIAVDEFESNGLYDFHRYLIFIHRFGATANEHDGNQHVENWARVPHRFMIWIHAICWAYSISPLNRMHEVKSQTPDERLSEVAATQRSFLISSSHFFIRAELHGAQVHAR